jgi:hypothetical protein
MADEAGTPHPAVEMPQPSQTPISVDVSALSTIYANFFRVTGTPEELILDFGLNAEHGQKAITQPIKLSHRLVLNFFTAKKLLGTLYYAVNRHEAMFGPVETDIQKRLRPTPPAQQ